MTRRNGGYILLDLVASLMLIGALTVALTAAVVRQNRAAERLAESRATIAVAEEALTRLQRGLSPTPPEPVRLTVRPVPDTAAIGGRVWVEVSVIQGQRATSLIGLIPQESLAKWRQDDAGRGTP